MGERAGRTPRRESENAREAARAKNTRRLSARQGLLRTLPLIAGRLAYSVRRVWHQRAPGSDGGPGRHRGAAPHGRGDPAPRTGRPRHPPRRSPGPVDSPAVRQPRRHRLPDVPRDGGPAAQDPGSHGRRGPADGVPGRLPLDRLQRRDLQLPRAAGRAGPARPSLPHVGRHRGGPRRVRGMGRALLRASGRDVGARHRRSAGPPARRLEGPLRDQAALLARGGRSALAPGSRRCSARGW